MSSDSPTAVVFTGGIVHPFDIAAPVLGEILRETGFAPRVSREMADIVDWLREDPAALLVVYALRWTMTQHEKYAPQRARWAFTLSTEARETMHRHVAEGGGLFGLHTASICFDDWSEWGELLGGAWQWGKSHHPPLGPVNAELDARHFLARGLDDFTLNDEAYSDQRIASGVEVFGWAEAGAGTALATGRQPVLWTHRYGHGRVVYDGLGHDAVSLQHPIHRQLVKRSARWAAGLSIEKQEQL
jgi:uncharacterized protein